MAFDSLVRLRQLNQVEISGWVEEIIGKRATGFLTTGTGILTGAFYPLNSNPSGYLTGVQTGDFVTNSALAISQQNLLNASSGLFYLKTNPSGYITQSFVNSGFVRNYPYANSGVEFVDDPSSTTVFSFLEGSHFYIQSHQGASILDVSGTVFNGVPTISGFAIRATDIKVNGKSVITETGDFISKTADSNNTRLYLYDGVLANAPFVFEKNNDFYLQGLSNNSIIDLYDSTRGGIRPFISGFDIYSDNIYISGVRAVVSGGGSSTGVSYAQLTGTSGVLADADEVLRANLILTGQKIGPPIVSPNTFYLTSDALAYSGKLYKSFDSISSLIGHITGNSLKDSLVYVGTGYFGGKGISNVDFGKIIFEGIYNYPQPSIQNFSLTFTNATGQIYTNNGINIALTLHSGSLITGKNYGGYSEAVVQSYNLSKVYLDGFDNLTIKSTTLSNGNYYVENSKIVGLTLDKNPPTATVQSFQAKNCLVYGFTGTSFPNTNVSFENCNILGASQLIKTSGDVPFLVFNNTGKSFPYSLAMYPTGGALGFDSSNLWLIKSNGTGNISTSQIITKPTGDVLYYSVSNPASYVTQNYVATNYLSQPTFLNDYWPYTVIQADNIHNTSLYLFQITESFNPFLFNHEIFTISNVTGQTIDVYGAYISGFNIYNAPYLSSSYIISSDIYAGGLKVGGNQKLYDPTLDYYPFYFIPDTDQYYLQNDPKGPYHAVIDVAYGTIKGFTIEGYLTGTSNINYINVTGAKISGNVSFTGIGGLQVLASGQTVVFSGGGGGAAANTGELTGAFYPLNSNPSGYITGNQTLGLPTDGSYGGSNGAIAGVTQGDRQEDAFDKVEVILGKLAPSKPSNLSSAAFSLTNTTYSGYMQGTATNFSGIMNSFFPTGRATGFYDGDAGILSGYINSNLTGLRVLTTGIDTGNFTGLNITGDFDFWSGVAGRAGFWSALSANVCPTGALSSGRFTMQMGHSTTGPTTILTGYCNAVQTPTATIQNIVTGNPATRIIDGVPSMGVGGVISGQISLGNTISAFYQPSIGNFFSSQTSNNTLTATGTPLSGETQVLSGVVTVSSSQFITGWIASATSKNASSTTSSTATSGTNIRIDTVSNQPSNRWRAGSGQYPPNGSAGLLLAYDNNLSLVSGEELQMINGIIQNPPSVNYTNIRPSGPNYIGIQTGSYGGATGYRWALFTGQIAGATSVTCVFGGTSNFSSVVLSDFRLYVKVSGSNPTNGWIDGNTAYGGVGDPTNDGDAALVIGSSSSTSKFVTFGTALRNGTVMARVGIPSGSNKSFSSLTVT
jgi:hypothetical protein